MANLTLALPDEVHKRMKERPEIRWSEVARRAIIEHMERLEQFERIERIAQKSKLTPEDVREIAAKVNKVAAKRLLGEYYYRR